MGSRYFRKWKNGTIQNKFRPRIRTNPKRRLRSDLVRWGLVIGNGRVEVRRKRRVRGCMNRASVPKREKPRKKEILPSLRNL